MKTCNYCGSSIDGRRKNAKYCSNICRIKAYRARHGISEPFEEESASNRLFRGQESKSYTCCENGQFYSTVGKWGEVLKCDNCGAVWVRQQEKK